MNKIVDQIQSLSNSMEELKQLKTILLKEEMLLQKNIGVLDDVLNILNAQHHSLAYTIIL